MSTQLNDADVLHLGHDLVDEIYLGAEKIYPAAFDPSTIAGLALWFDASQLALADGAAVSPWPNLANASLPGTIVSDAAPLPPKVHAGALNGRRVVRFNASEGRVRITPPASTGVHTTWTLVYVGRMVGPVTGRIVNAVYPTGGNLLVGWWNGNMDALYDAGFASNAYGPTDNSWRMYSADGTPGLTRLFLNGTLLGSTTTSAGWGNTFAISGYNPTDSSETCDCEAAEVCLFNRVLSTTERQQVEGYMRSKWGL